MDIEAILAKHTVRRAVVVGPIVVASAWLLRGTDGAAAGAVGVLIVVANFLASGWMLSTALKISLGAYHAAALFGFLLRLALITGMMFGVARIWDIDRVAMGVSAIVSYLVLISLEAVAVARGSERELEWSS